MSLLFLTCCSKEKPKLKIDYDVFGKRNKDFKELLTLSKSIDSCNVPARFWNDIANDNKYSIKRRQLCVLNMFKTNVKINKTTLGELSKITSRNSWMNDSEIRYITEMAGFCPLDIDEDLGLFVILVLNNEKNSSFLVITFTIIDKKCEVDKDNIEKLLKTGKGQNTIKSKIINQIDYDFSKKTQLLQYYFRGYQALGGREKESWDYCAE